MDQPIISKTYVAVQPNGGGSLMDRSPVAPSLFLLAIGGKGYLRL
jgi:hypothetical protein